LNAFKKYAFFPVIIVLVLQSTGFAQNDNNIIGKWESINRSNTGIGSSYVFYSNGKFDFITGAMIDYIYHIKNDRLITTFVNVFNKRVKKDTSFIEIKDNTLYQKEIANGKITNKIYTRVNKDYINKFSIIGKWKSQNEAGQTAFYNFTEDGMLYFRLPFEIKKGTFTIKGNNISFNFKNRTISESFRIKDEFLTLFNNTGSEQTYHKIK